MNTAEQLHTSRRFLFCLWEGGGTIPPELGLAKRLLQRGHVVHVLGDPTIEDDARAAGCSFTPWREAPHRTTLDPAEDLLRDWEVKNPLVMLGRIRDIFMAGPAAAFAADTTKAIEAFAPDVLVPDFMLLGAIIAAQAKGIPVVPVVPNIWMLPTKGCPAIGPGFPPAKTALGRTRDAVMLAMANRMFGKGLPTLNAVRADYGLPALMSFYDQVLHNERIAVLTSPTFDFSSAFVPAHARYLGPIIDDPDWAQAWQPPWPPSNTDPLVLVGFSSTFQDQGPLLRRVVEVLSDLPVRAVVTRGQMLAADEVEGSANVQVVESAPHAAILAEAAAVITHCGHGTTIKALSAGVPLVCLPMGRDQNDTAARVVQQGAGVRLKPTADAVRIRAAVTEVLQDASYREAATRLAERMAAEAAAIDVVAEFEALAELRETNAKG